MLFIFRILCLVTFHKKTPMCLHFEKTLKGHQNGYQMKGLGLGSKNMLFIFVFQVGQGRVRWRWVGRG
jgi:hypothetical protein